MNPQLLEQLFQALGIRMPQGFGTQPSPTGNTLPATAPAGGGASMGPSMSAFSGSTPTMGGTSGGFGAPGK